MSSQPIHFSNSGLSEEIAVFNAIRAAAESPSPDLKAQASVLSGGQTATALEELAKASEAANTIFAQIINRTVSFLTDAQNSITAADKNAANGVQSVR